MYAVALPGPRARVGAEEKQLQLGLPGAWAVDSSEPSDHYTTKIGGLPDWPPSLQHSLLRDELLKCAVCGGWLGLVAQVYAPLALPHPKQLSDRTIYVFGCPAQGCGMDPACWRTIRVQKEHLIVTDAGEVDKEGTNSSPLEHSKLRIESSAVEPVADWWEEGNSWGDESMGGDANATQKSEKFLNMNELAASLMEAGQLAAEKSHEELPSTKGNGRGSGQGMRRPSIDTESPSPKFPLPVLPCFYVYFQGESISQEKTRASPSSFPANVSETTTGNPIEEAGDNGAEIWEGEEYEYDRALYVDRTYLRFKKHLDLNPEQCFRYCFGGQVLWAVEDEVKVAPGKCGACGGPQVCEMQLMPPLLYFLQEAMKNASAPMSYLLDEWDWFTLIVVTCAQSCSQKADEGPFLADWHIVEEATILQQEATRICAADLSSKYDNEMSGHFSSTKT